VRVLVIGGGISGCVAALIASQAGHAVTLVERAQRLGGILADQTFGGERWYRTCQYANTSPPWFRELRRSCGGDWLEFPHRYGSWSDLFGTVVLHHDFAQVVVPERAAEAVGGSLEFASAADRLTRYPSNLSQVLLEWASRWGRLDDLAPENCNMMQLGRVFMRDDVEGTRSLKASSVAADALYGLPRSLCCPQIEVQGAAVPRDGWDSVMASIHDALRRHRAQVLTGRAAVPRLVEAGRVHVDVDGARFDAELLIWCANPTPLVRLLLGERLDAPLLRMRNWYFECEGDVPSDPVYWQVFSNRSPIVRIFAYPMASTRRVTVEAFDVETSGETIREDATRMISDLAGDVRLRTVGAVADRRYVLLTNEDKRRLDALSSASLRAGVVPGGWSAYGRDQRLASVLGGMRELGVG
jgi:glycine/D-amino acid oxidase-like deaminating enzyme